MEAGWQMMRDVVKVCWLSISGILLPGHVHRYTTLTLDLDLITDCPATCRATPYRLPVPSPLPTTTPCAHPTLAMTTRLFSLPSFATMSPSLPVRGEQQAQQGHVHESGQAGRQAAALCQGAAAKGEQQAQQGHQQASMRAGNQEVVVVVQPEESHPSGQGMCKHPCSCCCSQLFPDQLPHHGLMHNQLSAVSGTT
jgi:hypothetical protein